MGFETNKRFARDFNSKSETVEIGGKVCRFRSQGEIKLARHLELLKIGGHIRDWQFEQTTFRFPDDKYLVDFDVILPDGSLEYYEYKGMFDARSRRKLSLIQKYRPEVRVNLVFGSKADARKVSKKMASACKRVCVLSATKGLIDFDRTEIVRKRK